MRSASRERPSSTFFFGDDADKAYQGSLKSYPIETKKKFGGVSNNHNFTIERDIKVKDSVDRLRRSDLNTSFPRKKDYEERGFVGGNIQTRNKSIVNDRVVRDNTTKESFGQQFQNADEKDNVFRNFDEILEKSSHYVSKLFNVASFTLVLTFNDVFVQKFEDSKPSRSPTSNEIQHYIHMSNGTSRKDPASRQRNYDYSPPPLSSYSLGNIRDTNVSRSSYRTSTKADNDLPPSSGGTWTKSKGKKLTLDTKQDDFPEFSPLLSPSEIKNFTEAFSSRNTASFANKYSDHFVVRDWDSRY